VKQVGSKAGTTDGLLHILLARPEGGSDAAGWARALQGLGQGVSVQVVPDAANCARLCASLPVDLLVLDAAMPTTEARRILAGLHNGGPPLVVAHGEVDLRVSAAWQAQGAVACVSTPAELRVCAQELMARARGAGNLPQRATAEAAYEAIVRSINSAVLVVDGKRRIAFCNAQARATLGLDAACQGASLKDVLGEFGPDHPLERALVAGESADAVETAIPLPGGGRLQVGLSCAPIEGEEGQRLGAVAVLRELGEASRLRGDVLQREKMASIGQLAAGVAHEINNPMGFIHANLFQMTEYVSDLRLVWNRVESLQKAALGGDVEATRVAAQELASAAEEVDVSFVLSDLGKAIRESQEGSERVRHIVQDLRDFSHPDTGQRVLTDLNQSLDSTANIVWPMMKHVVVLEREYADLPEVPCYPMQLKQVFMNLLVNAYQAIAERVGESGELGTIRLRTEAVDGAVVVTVADDGTGISEEDRQRIFDPFFTTKKVGVGMGLGLSTSFQIVERHGGTLVVTSARGVGTTMRLSLPLLELREPGA
jgi:signal transduction histidine kinase